MVLVLVLIPVLGILELEMVFRLVFMFVVC